MILFLVAGFASMSTALSAGALNKMPKDQREGFFASNNGALFVVMAGNIAAVTLIGAMAYGFKNLHWALPLSCMFVSFPMVHILLLQKLLGSKWSLLIMIVPTLVSAVALYSYW
jgi:hypothetical protein